jgi:hypothetical protein
MEVPTVRGRGQLCHGFCGDFHWVGWLEKRDGKVKPIDCLTQRIEFRFTFVRFILL